MCLKLLAEIYVALILLVRASSSAGAAAIYVSAYDYICVRILLYVSAYYCKCVLGHCIRHCEALTI